MPHPPAYPHDSIEEIQPDVFMVRGSIKLNALMTITRNMGIVRHNGDLTLIDPLRLSAAEEQQLDALGTVRRLIRLGPMHGVDDPYYVDRYGAELWVPGSSRSFPETKADLEFDATTEVPFPDGAFFSFERTKEQESALLLNRGKGILFTCDSIQHYGDYRHNNLPARLLMPLIGFPRTTVVGPMWLKMMTPEGGNLEGDFRRLLELRFDQLLSAHGSLLETGAHASVERAVDKAFARE